MTVSMVQSTHVPPPEAAVAVNPVLRVEDVTVSLGGRTVLDQVTFECAPGSFTGLIGSNGAGKTTLMRVILGLLNPARGSVTLDGLPVTQGRRHVGYVPQKIALESDVPLRARDLVGLGLDGHRLGAPLPRRARRETVEEMLEAVNATRFADSRVGRLSGGEQQRIMIAHALISRPRLLVLDEPLANLDIRSSQEIVELLGRIVKTLDVAVLLSAHDVNPLLPVMDRLVYLADGRAASGPTDEVVRTETLSALYGHRVQVIHAEGRILVVGARDESGDGWGRDQGDACGHADNAAPLRGL